MKDPRLALAAQSEFAERWLQPEISGDLSLLGLGELDVRHAEARQGRAAAQLRPASEGHRCVSLRAASWVPQAKHGTRSMGGRGCGAVVSHGPGHPGRRVSPAGSTGDMSNLGAHSPRPTATIGWSHGGSEGRKARGQFRC